MFLNTAKNELSAYPTTINSFHRISQPWCNWTMDLHRSVIPCSRGHTWFSTTFSDDLSVCKSPCVHLPLQERQSGHPATTHPYLAIQQFGSKVVGHWKTPQYLTCRPPGLTLQTTFLPLWPGLSAYQTPTDRVMSFRQIPTTWPRAVWRDEYDSTYYRHGQTGHLRTEFRATHTVDTALLLHCHKPDQQVFWFQVSSLLPSKLLGNSVPKITIKKFQW